MTETLLSASNVILFGRRMGDLKIVVPREEYRGPGRRFEADFVLGRSLDSHLRELIHDHLELTERPRSAGDVETELDRLKSALKDRCQNGEICGPDEIGKISVEKGDLVLLRGEHDANGDDNENWSTTNGLYVVVDLMEVSKVKEVGDYEIVGHNDTQVVSILKRLKSAHDRAVYNEGIVVAANIGDRPDLDGRTFVLDIKKPKDETEAAASTETTATTGDGESTDGGINKWKFCYKLTARNRRHSPFVSGRMGANRQLEEQLLKKRRPCLARIYGFSYEGRYYELDHPSIFLVHGSGELVSGISDGKQEAQGAKSPGDPSISGMSAADFQFADELRAWSYDRADYTIRMEMDSGMFEQVLLEPFLGGAGVSGAKLSGAKVSGAKVSGAKVSGAKVSGAKVSGAKLSGDASD